MTATKKTKLISFVDSNIWLYAFIDSQDKTKHHIAKTIIQKDEITISTQVINETCVNLLKKAKFSEQNIRALIDSFYANYTVTPLTLAVLTLSSKLREQHSLSFWDSLIVSAALSADCQVLYSEDMQDGLLVDNKLTIKNPFSPIS